MIASDLISNIITPLRNGDTGEDALTIMNIYHVKHLPIVSENRIINVLSEDDILSQDLTQAISNYPSTGFHHCVAQNDHLFEVLGKLGRLNLSTISVIGENEQFIGIITMEDLLQFYANSFSFSEPGSIIVLETNRIDYSLADISRIIESENAHILSSFLSQEVDNHRVLVTLKLNTHEVQRIISSLERYDYLVKATFAEEEYFQGLKERYDALMKYLSV